MDTIHIDVANARQVGLRFEAFPDALYDDLRREIDGLSAELFAMVQAATPVKTGRLLSQERVRLFTDKERITGYIDIAGEGSGGGSDFAKAAALEYGANATVAVSAHSMRLDHYWSYKLNSPVSVLVDAYSRPTTIAQRAYERGPLAQIQPQVMERLNAVVAKNVAEANA
ncbi:MAG: hypothetical protein KGJ57_17430 [Sphingomonadales bacterium]|nr:hypothetical protein [Sphingomonadales bacterium]MDE2171180.1 hypothetical protein [Sphingomonadales bacterium]